MRTYTYAEPVDEAEDQPAEGNAPDPETATISMRGAASRPDFDAGYDVGYRAGWSAGYEAAIMQRTEVNDE
jgi:hypothetical protein